MEQIAQLTDLRLKYSETLNLIKDYPDIQRLRAETRYLLIKECEDFLKHEFERLSKKFRRSRAIEEFCDINGLNRGTLYRHMKRYREGGIEALVSAYGPRKSRGPVADIILPIIKEIIEPGKGYKPILNKLVVICKQRGIKAPIYATFRHIIIANGLSDLVVRKKVLKTPLVESPPIEKKETLNKDLKPYKIYTPEWIRVVNKKAFNVAICKYSLILPLLNPCLDRKEKDKLIDEITLEKHHPLPGVTIKMTRATLLKYISIVRKKGFDGLIRIYSYHKPKKYKNIIRATFRIDMNNPLACLQQLKEVIEATDTTSSTAKKTSLNFLAHCLCFANPKVHAHRPIFLERPLTKEEILKLKYLKAYRHDGAKDRATGILMANNNRSMLEISMATGRNIATIYRWLKKYKDEGIDFIVIKHDSTKNNPELRHRKNRIIKILHHSPKDYGINRTSWILRHIALVYKNEYGKTLSKSLIRKSIKATKYSWRSARRVLTSPDPKYREKTKKVLDTLRNLESNDAFFFIDEGGPYQVKKYGGKSWTPKGAIKTFPQFQKPKGRVTFIGGLDALKNHVTLFFTKSKNTAAVVCLIKILFYRYHGYSTLYLTWDCASWHRSKKLQECLDKLNADEKSPSIKVVPLPKQSQFLNVIESVFSGMKKAVIFNSDYQSEYEMKVAIDRHFQERNEFYKENPKRVGNKIWDKEYYNLDELDSGLFRRM